LYNAPVHFTKPAPTNPYLGADFLIGENLNLTIQKTLSSVLKRRIVAPLRLAKMAGMIVRLLPKTARATKASRKRKYDEFGWTGTRLKNTSWIIFSQTKNRAFCPFLQSGGIHS
jgi:hypothetical protein